MTETRLTADLYKSHFGLSTSMVRFSSVEILKFTNLLWKYMQSSSQGLTSGPIIINPPEEDRLYDLIQNIMPRRKVKGRDKMEVVPWDQDGHIWLESQHGEMHNFQIKARFMEFERTDLEEPTFCVKSLAPVPRSLALPEQRKRRGVRAVRNMKQREEERGPTFQLSSGDRVYAYEVLEDLLQLLAGHCRTDRSLKVTLSGTTFYDLGMEIEFLAKKIAANIDEGRANESDETLLQRLDAGRTIVTKLREKSYTAPNFYAYLDWNIGRRAHYTKYLQRIKDATQEIYRARVNYRSELKDRHAMMTQVARLSSSCDLPAVIIGMAEQKSIMLTMLKARKTKIKTRKDRPTPAQVVLDSLKSTSGDGKVTEEMKQMVDVPSQSYTLKQLSDKGVIVRMHEKFERRVKDKMRFNFQYESEGYRVSMFMKTTLLKELFICRRDIVGMQRSHKNTDMTFGDGLLTMNCFRLKRLLAFISAEGGL